MSGLLGWAAAYKAMQECDVLLLLHVSTRRPIHPEYVAATVGEVAGENAVFTIDTGMCAVWGRALPA